MPEGLQRFEVQLAKLEQILIDILPSAGPALAFYQSPARQYLFYLEALTLIYRKIHNSKRFERMRISFKSLEDQLGKVDYYDAFIKEFSAQENFPVVLLDQLKWHKAKELKLLDGLLRHDGWINKESGVIRIIESELQYADWKSDPDERRAIGERIINDIGKINMDYHSGKLNFDDIEHGVHEFRRQVRWISIHAQALNGLIQIKDAKVSDPNLASYLTKEVVESPFNKLPPAKKDIRPIYLEAPNFYALSWIIAESGKLKDEGLRILCLESLIRETEYVHEQKLKSTTRQLAIRSTRSPRQIKETMKVMAEKFMFHDKVLERIVHDIRNSITE